MRFSMIISVPTNTHEFHRQWWNGVLWAPFPDGPDWTLETSAAYDALDTWRAAVLTKQPQSGYKQPIVAAITTKQSMAFGGFGRHLANDYLFTVAIHPGLSSLAVCSDDTLWGRLRSSIHSYMQQWEDQRFISTCVASANVSNPLAFNYRSDYHYLRSYTKVYYKKHVRVPGDLYNLYASLGYLNPDHTIGSFFLFTLIG